MLTVTQGKGEFQSPPADSISQYHENIYLNISLILAT